MSSSIKTMEVATPILRFNFSEDIMSMITDFAKTHMFDDRRTYKEHWETWFEENNDELSLEIYRLEKNGYKGDIKDKMYKAGRYYFRKKQLITEVKSDAAGAADANVIQSEHIKKTRFYISMDKIIIDAMDKHIMSSIRTHNAYGLQFKPAIGWDDFCKTCNVLIDDEHKRLATKHAIGSDVISNKIKKTYKNRYFIITR